MDSLSSSAPNQRLRAEPTTTSILFLPDELLLHICTFLDIPDLHNLTQTTSHLRILASDPLLHVARLHRVYSTLKLFIPFRPSLADLIAHRIYITRTTLVARRLGRDLIRIKLNRKLVGRPTVETLVEKGVLPGECYVTGKGGKIVVAPALVEVKRRIEKERVKDILRGWVDEWRRKCVEKGVDMEEERPDVRRLVRRFARIDVGGNTGRKRDKRREDPSRAKVLGLRRFWEGVGREGASASMRSVVQITT